ncbi:hypothetical protein FEM48_Zijuj06G0144300 [Ziziphus jujuba var. spinosa]|uniref:Uncharacterized protein n=1 Tax=Ziziphus jujuba var. spinosa TaxID=714518 RepID=A0A978V9T5_ZIZJJ|nr:hypothetical protein FEM48_Zijuj06G0144300 [Ziziphus jujuba var. spinosa]
MRYMQQHNEVELSALGMDVKFTSFYALLNWHLYFSIAIATVVTIAEILKNNGLAVEKSNVISTHLIRMRILSLEDWMGNFSVEDLVGNFNGCEDCRIEILLGKSEKFDELMAAAAAEEAIEYEE